nr:protein MAIN-LIKE 1-like [Aegilops tauschii subsp. strangulata]
MRAHKTTVKMEYDERYTPFFRRARLLGFVPQFKCKPPTLIHSALTAFIDRCRPETHSFHLPCGEMTVTLEDWAIITALPLEGRALTGRVERTNWHDRGVTLIGDCPPPAKSNRTFGIPLPWLLEHRSKCPEDAEARVVEQYGRAYLWYLLTEVVFLDCSGNSALWMYLDFLKDRDARYSWGAAGLAYLYPLLDDATQRAEVTSDDEDDRNPTIAYTWDVVHVYTGESKALYKVFSNELDALTPFQVTWRPYNDDREWGFELNNMCKQERLLWRCIMPMICVYAVEYHLPQRVVAQFGKAQHTPPAGIVHDTSGYDLHL